MPEASVAIVVSGSGAVREHVQRLGEYYVIKMKRERLFTNLSQVTVLR